MWKMEFTKQLGTELICNTVADTHSHCQRLTTGSKSTTTHYSLQNKLSELSLSLCQDLFMRLSALSAFTYAITQRWASLVAVVVLLRCYFCLFCGQGVVCIRHSEEGCRLCWWKVEHCVELLSFLRNL